MRSTSETHDPLCTSACSSLGKELIRPLRRPSRWPNIFKQYATIVQKKPHDRLMSVIFLPAILRPGMAALILWALVFFLQAKNSMPIKFFVLGGGGCILGWGGECRLYGRGNFLLNCACDSALRNHLGLVARPRTQRSMKGGAEYL